MKKIFFTFLLLIVFPAFGTHIVGGEFELLHISGERYQLNMILYFDVLHGAAGARDPSVTASIWRKSDKAHMADFVLGLDSESLVGYTKPECSHGEIVTNRMFYTTDLDLPASIYNDPGGYYISWQRCCRNYSITNIYSDAADGINTHTAGQTFYLEFPAVVKDGQPFYNSSPRLFPPLNDYACPGRSYFVDFSGTDDDGDSLVYSLTTPIGTTSAQPLPDISPGPYPGVLYRPPFSQSSIMKGSPDLAISLNGFLTVTPGPLGLFVFAVRVEQFRNKVKIGETRRDFQMLVVDGCTQDEPPLISGRKLGDVSFGYTNTMAVTFSNTTPDGSRCVEVQVSDPDSQSSFHNFTENVSVKVIPLDFFSDDLSEVLPSVTNATLTNGSVSNFRLCFPRCPYKKSGTFKIGVVAYDDACALPRSDTLEITVTVVPPFNTPPHFTAPTPLPFNITLTEGDQGTWPFMVVDDQLDSMQVQYFTDGFDLAKSGMTITYTTNKKGLIAGTLHWDAYCNIYDFTQRTAFRLSIVANDIDVCNFGDPVTAFFNLNVKLPGFADVFIDTDLTSDPHESKVVLERKIYESVSFDVTGTQADGDFIVLDGKNPIFNFADYGMSFTPASGNGFAKSHFQWDTNCQNVALGSRNVFDLYFTVLDNTNKCRVPKWDTVLVEIKMFPPTNAPPELTIASLNNLTLSNTNEMTVTLGQEIAVSLIGIDTDTPEIDNSLELTMTSAKGSVTPEGYSFKSATGSPTVTSPFTWHPDCAIFENADYSNDYTFNFLLKNKACVATTTDTLTLHITINDINATPSPFSPSNVITPNGDYCNDYLAMEGLDEDLDAAAHCERIAGKDAMIALPKDNCAGHFEYIRIYNRWGNEVFKSTDRKFRWYALNMDAGVYYYSLEFSNRHYKGSVSVRP